MAKKFNEFLQEKAKTAVVADYSGPQKDGPPDGGAPYKGKGGKGDWAEKGSQPQYTPGKSKKVKKAEQIKEGSGSFVEATRGMDPKKFFEFMRRNSKNAAVIHETARRTGHVLKENRAATGALIRETKRNGTFGRLVVEMLGHEEFFETMALAMGSKQMGKTVCRKLARAMNEMIGPPAPGAAPPPRHKKGIAGQLGNHDDGMPDDDEDMGDQDDDMGDDEDMGDQDDDLGLDPDMGDQDDPMGTGDDPMGDDDSGLGHPLSPHHLPGGKMGGPAGGPAGQMGLDDEPGMGDDSDPFGGGGAHGDSQFGDDAGDDGDDAPDDGDEDDEDDSDDGEDDDNPFGGDKNPFKKKGLPEKKPFDGPKPSMMTRMMRREQVATPAQRNFMDAFKAF